MELYDSRNLDSRYEMTSFVDIAQVPRGVPYMKLENGQIFVQMQRNWYGNEARWEPVNARTQKDRIMKAVHIDYVPTGMDISK